MVHRVNGSLVEGSTCMFLQLIMCITCLPSVLGVWSMALVLWLPFEYQYSAYVGVSINEPATEDQLHKQKLVFIVSLPLSPSLTLTPACLIWSMVSFNTDSSGSTSSTSKLTLASL